MTDLLRPADSGEIARDLTAKAPTRDLSGYARQLPPTNVLRKQAAQHAAIEIPATIGEVPPLRPASPLPPVASYPTDPPWVGLSGAWPTVRPAVPTRLEVVYASFVPARPDAHRGVHRPPAPPWAIVFLAAGSSLVVGALAALLFVELVLR